MSEAEKTAIAFAEIEPMHSYAIASGLTVPRPIGWLGTVSAAGVHNLAPYSFFNMVAHAPPTFVVSPMLGSRKDTLTNLEDTGVFTINVVTEETFDAMNRSSGTYDANVDEFELTGLTAIVSDTCPAPRVGEATANFECTVVDMVPVGHPTGDLPGSGMLVIGEAHRVHVSDRVLDGHRIDQAELRAIGRHAGPWYSRTGDSLFSAERPD